MRTDYKSSDYEGISTQGWFSDDLDDEVLNDSECNEILEGTEGINEVTGLEENDDVNVEKLFMHDKLVECYKDLESAMAIRNQSEILKQEEIVNKQNYNDTFTKDEKDEDDLKPIKKKGLSKGAWVGIIVGGLVVIGIIITIVYMCLNNGNSNPVNPIRSRVSASDTIQNIQSRVDLLYTDNLKSGIKDGYSVSDLDAFRLELKSLPKTVDYTSLSNELNTMEAYMNDIKVVNTYADLGYNIEPDFVGTNCNTILNGLGSYTVAGLKATVNNKVNEVISDRNLYLQLKGELSSVTDVLNFDGDKYTDRIKGVKHIINKSELDSLVNKLNADKKIAVAEKALQDASDKKSQEDAAKALQEAQDNQKEMASQLEKVQGELEEALKNQKEPSVPEKDSTPEEETNSGTENTDNTVSIVSEE